MKITFVQPFYENIWEALGIGYIGAYCKKHMPDLETSFYQGKFDTDEQIIAGAQYSDVVAFSCTSPAFPHAVRLATALKEINPSIRTVVGGWHPSALKEASLLPCIDQIVIAEGEDAMLQILDGNTNRMVTGRTMSFDELPWPDRQLIKNWRTIDLCKSMNGRRTTSFQANRVCPFNCIFCSERIVTGKFNKVSNPIRTRSVVDVCNEIDAVARRFNLDYFKFVDATFDTSAGFVIDFCKEKLRRPEIANLEWECLVHASLATEEMIYWLKESKCNQINVGVESGSNKILRDIGKGLRTDIVERVFGWAKKYQLERRAFFILGMPNETWEDLRMTDQLIERIQPDVVGFTILCPYPGTPLYDPAKHQDVDWEKADEYSNDFWSTPHFTNQELHAWQAYFKTKYEKALCERQEIVYAAD